MGFYPLMRTSWVGWTPLSPRAAGEALQNAVLGGSLRGDVDAERFELRYDVPNVRNSWRPVMTGTLRPQGSGSLVEVALTVHPFVFVFTLIHGLLLFGISWLIGAAAFSFEVGKATRALSAALGVTLEGDEALAAGLEIADPAEPGAEASAPHSLHAGADGDSVTFRVGRATVEVDRAWLVVTPPGDEPVRLAWDDVGAVDVHDLDHTPHLVVEGPRAVVLPAADVPREHLEWLADYVESRAARWRGSPEDRVRAAQQRRALSRLKGAVGE